MDHELPAEAVGLLRDLDDFLDAEIRPLQAENDNERFFDHRREFARTDFDRGGTPRAEWEELLGEMFRRADRAGWLRYGLPTEVGGSGGSNFEMALVREHLAAKGLGLHNDLQNESSVVGNFPFVHMFLQFGTAEQRTEFVEGMLTREKRVGFGLTEPDHGSEATWLETTAVPDGDDWIINGGKRFNSGMHSATHDVVFARTSGEGGDSEGITAFVVLTGSPGFSVDFHWWTFNMPTDHAEVTLRDVRVPGTAVFGEVGRGLALAQHFVHENRIRQAASGVGAAQHCIDRSVAYARERVTFGQPLAARQAIQWPLVELQTEAELVRGRVRKTAWELDRTPHWEISDKVSMCNYRANRLVCDAADRAMQVHGGLGYTPARALRAHLPPPPPVPDHRGGRGDPDAQGRRLPVRFRRAPEEQPEAQRRRSGMSRFGEIASGRRPPRFRTCSPTVPPRAGAGSARPKGELRDRG